MGVKGKEAAPELERLRWHSVTAGVLEAGQWPRGGKGF